MSRVAIEKAAVDIDMFSKRANNNKYFSFFVIRNIHHLMPEIQSINAIRQSMMASDRIKEYDTKRIEIVEKFCKKDEQGKPLYIAQVDNFNNVQNVYDFTPENREKFTEEFKILSSEYADDLADFEASVNEFAFLMNEEIEIDIAKISFKNIPEDINISNIIKFIEEPQEEIEKVI
jgi:hypothetical protein